MTEDARRRSDVQPLAHFLAGLEIGHPLGVDVDRFAGPRVAADARLALARRESAEAAQLDPAAVGWSVIESKKAETTLSISLPVRSG